MTSNEIRDANYCVLCFESHGQLVPKDHVANNKEYMNCECCGRLFVPVYPRQTMCQKCRSET